jgi:UDP-N-acetylmuramate dehydrogenase
VNILRNESLKDSNTLSLPASAKALVELEAIGDIPKACEYARQEGLALVPLGQGSNVVLAGDINALVLRLDNRGIDVLEENESSVKLRVAAGEDWHALVQWTLSRDYFGLENLALIPGTAGAAPVQNIGAYGVELQSCLERVHATEIATAQGLVLSRDECRFAYRDSVFKGDLRDKLIITAIDLVLSRRSSVSIDYPALAARFQGRAAQDVTPRDVFQAVVDIRRSRLPDPAELPNLGSFFKNPLVSERDAARLAESFPGLPQFKSGGGRVKLAAAWLIEHCGWKGFREADVGVHPDHALVLVNYGSGTGREVLALARRIATSVEDAFGIELTIEPRVYGG